MDELQTSALVQAAAFLDVAAGEGIGIQVHKTDGSTITLFADDVVTALAVSFDLELGDTKLPFRNAVKSALTPPQENDHG